MTKTKYLFTSIYSGNYICRFVNDAVTDKVLSLDFHFPFVYHALVEGCANYCKIKFGDSQTIRAYYDKYHNIIVTSYINDSKL